MDDDLAVHCIIPGFCRQTVQSLFLLLRYRPCVTEYFLDVSPSASLPINQENRSHTLASCPLPLLWRVWRQLAGTDPNTHPPIHQEAAPDVLPPPSPKFNRAKAGRPPTRTHMPTQRSMVTSAANGCLPLSLNRGLPYL